MKPEVAAGQVWWCEGGAMGFEARFKTRPALVIVAQEGGDWLVMPLSSKRRFGQEPIVTHGGKVSYMTGGRAVVPASALISFSGNWEGFPAWRDEATLASPSSWWDWLLRLFGRR